MLPQPIKLFSKFNEVRNISWTLGCYARPLCRMRVRLYKIFFVEKFVSPNFLFEGMKKNFSEKLNLFWQASQEFLYPSIKYENLGKRKKKEKENLACKLHQEAIVSNTLLFSSLVQELKPRLSLAEVHPEQEEEKSPLLFNEINPLLRQKVRVFPYPGAIQFTSSYFLLKGAGKNLGWKIVPHLKRLKWSALCKLSLLSLHENRVGKREASV